MCSVFFRGLWRTHFFVKAKKCEFLGGTVECSQSHKMLSDVALGFGNSILDGAEGGVAGLMDGSVEGHQYFL